MLRTILILVAMSLLGSVAYAQTKIGDNVLNIDSASILELESTSRGFLPSRMSSAQRDAQTQWDQAHIIYNTTENCLQIYTGTVWLCIQQGTPIDSSIYKQNGTLRSDRTVTMNDNDLTFDGSRDIIITDDGRLGIGDLSPDALLDVEGGTVRLSDYGRGANPGQKTFLLGVDSDGDVIEVDTASVGTDDQTIDALFIQNDTLFISLEDDGVSDLYVNLAPYLDGDSDWFVQGGINKAGNITDSIYTFGNVGINTNSPGASLHVVDQADTYAGPWAIIEGGGGVFPNTALQLYDKGTGANNQNIIEFAHRVSGNPVSLATIRSNSDAEDHVNGADLILETTSDNSGTINSNQLYLKNDGNIGIGTSTPDEDLHIAGDMRLDGSFEDKDGDAGSSGDVLTSTVTGTDWVAASSIGSDDQAIDSLALEGNTLQINIEDDANGLQTLDLSPLTDTDWLAIGGSRATSINDSIYTMGRVGIGIATPSGKLHVSTEGSEDILFTRFDNDASNDLDLDFIGGEGTSGAPTSYSGLSTGNRMGGIRFRSYVDPGSFFSNPLDAFAPIAEIAGETDGTYSTTSAPGKLVFGTTAQGSNRPSERMVIKNDGKVGINISAPDELLHIGGNMRLDNAFEDKDGDAGSSGDVLTSTVTGTDWVAAATIGSDNQAIDTFSINGSDLLQLSLENDGEAAQTVDLSPYLDDQTVAITGAGIATVAGTYPNFTITATEVDGSTTNETITNFTYTAASGQLRITEAGSNFLDTISVMSGATGGVAGVRGLVPDALAGEQSFLLTAAGTWVDPSTLSGINIYSDDGTLDANRTVGLSTFNLIFDGTTDVIIESDGDVGIGTTNPSAKLHVAGNLRLDEELEDKDGDAGSSGDVLTSTGTGTDWVAASTIGSDDQTIDTFSINGSDLLQLSLENDGEAAQTVDLSPYLDDQTVTITGAGTNTVTGTYPSFTITATEVDGSTTNETITNFTYTAASGQLRITEAGSNFLDTITVMSGASGGSAGVRGLVPDALAGEQTYLLTAAGTWVNPNTLSGANIYNSDGTLDADRTVGLSTFDLTFDAGHDIVFDQDGNVGIGKIPTSRLDVESQDNEDAFKFVQTDDLTGERDVFTIEDQDEGGGGQDESSVLKVLKSGSIDGSDDGFSLIELANTGTDPGDDKYWISGRKVDEGAPLWGIDITDNDYWSEGGIVLGVTGADGGTYSGGSFRVEQDGDVGIGTTTPGARLEVAGGSVIFDDYGVGTHADTSADYILATNVDGDVVELNTAKNTRWFYAPAVTIDASAIVSGEMLDLHQEYVDQFASIPVGQRSLGAPATIPFYGESELYYYVPYYDNEVIDNVSISATGVLSYDIIKVPFDNYTIINVIFLIK